MLDKIEKIRCILIIAVILSTLITASMVYVVVGSPTSTAIVSIEPSSIINTTLVSGETFVINVTIANVTDLYTWQIRIYFDIDVVNVTDAYYPADHVFIGKMFIPVTPTVDNDANGWYILHGCTLMGAETTFSGNGMLCQIQFEVKGIGNSTLQFSRPLGAKTFLIDSNSLDIPFVVEDGYFSNAPPPPPPTATKLYVDPPEIIDPTLLPSATVEVNITVDDVENMYGYEFELGYDKNILICIGVVIQEVFGEINYIPNLSIDNTAGIVWVNVTYYPPANPITTDSPIALASITFRIRSTGSSVLDLDGTNLVDQTGQPITHEVEDGLIMTLIRDVAIVDVTVSLNSVYPGWVVNITVVVRNEGDQSETFVVNILYGATVIENHTVTDLASDAETTFTFSWDTKDVPPCSNYTISAEAPALPDEEDTTDNVFEDGYVKIKLLGDINGDGSIDMKDVSDAAQAFGSYPGHPRWNPEIDLDGDGQVSMRDLAIVTTNFGKTCES